MDELREQKLVDRIVGGDKRAFRTLIEQYQRLVSHIVFRMVVREADREDICQDVFCKVYENIHRFQGRSKLSTWIAQIATHHCLNHLKKKRVSLYDDLDNQEDSGFDAVDRNESPDEQSIASDLSALVRHEMNHLSPMFRAVLSLYHLNECSYTEIAEITGWPVGTVKSYLYRARQDLKKRLEKKYREEAFWRQDI